MNDVCIGDLISPISSRSEAVVRLARGVIEKQARTGSQITRFIASMKEFTPVDVFPRTNRRFHF